MIGRLFVLVGIIVTSFGSVLAGQGQSPEWPQWRGPNRDGVLTSFTEPATWPEQLTQRWKVDVGTGYATPLIAGNRIYIFSRQGEEEVMQALDADSGKSLWRTAYPTTFTMNSAAVRHNAGPKATPVLSNGRLYSIGMTGTVTAFDAASGKQLWQKPGTATLMPMYTTHSFSPIVERGLVIFHVGGHDKGALTAYDVNTGEVKWSWAGDGPGYGSPMVAEFGGTRQLVTNTQSKLIGIDPATGTLLWEHPFESSNFTNSMTPTVVGQTVMLSNNNKPATAISITRQNNKWMTATAWENPDGQSRMTNTVVFGDAIFGLSTRNMGQYYALDPKTGKTVWTSEPRQAGNASLLRSGNTVLSLEDDGELVVFRRNGMAFEAVKRYQLANSETWGAPSIAGNRIFVKDVSTLTLWTLN
jgi:outer membrane protein assembly factor BamB